MASTREPKDCTVGSIVSTSFVAQEYNDVLGQWRVGPDVEFQTPEQAQEWLDFTRENYPRSGRMRIVKRTDEVVFIEAEDER